MTIDRRVVEVPDGATVLDAARQLGIEIPTLCFLGGHPANTSCMLCLVKADGRWMPSCATPAAEGMVVESETDEVRSLRRTGLELLLSDHQGDCAAPCEHACPLHLDIPLMLQQVSDGDLAGAIATIRRDMALPSIMGRVCGDLCEKACRRKEVDGAAAICLVKRFVADADLASGHPHLPPRRTASGKQIAILGAGPAGLSAAYHLLLAGHDCTLFDSRAQAGGVLRYEIGEEQLPRTLLDQEIGMIVGLGARLVLGVAVTASQWVAASAAPFEAVLLADWPFAPNEAQALAARLAAHVYFASDPARPQKQPARLLADGKAAAERLDELLSRRACSAAPPVFHVRAGRVPRDEIVALTVRTGAAARLQPEEVAAGALTLEQARTEADRCLHCDCGKRDGCTLRRYAAMLGARPNRHRGQRRPIERRTGRGEVIFEPGKCILCGICVRIATDAREPLGLTFIGRGFDVQVAAPWNRAVEEGLTRVAEECIRACPTGALTRGAKGGAVAAGSCFGTALRVDEECMLKPPNHTG